jgi:hypothetical protein
MEACHPSTAMPIGRLVGSSAYHPLDMHGRVHHGSRIGLHSSFRFLPNQWISRHRLRPMRARCSITQRLFGEISKSLQISSEDTPSISRSKNT